jgi:putative ABC transport system permease protein
MRQRLRLDRLEQLLAGSRVSQNHWAMRLGLSRGHWSDLRSGRHPHPSARTRQRMVEVFGVAEQDLFEPDRGARDEELDFRLAIAARFELTSELGQGGMGTVYLANDLTLRRVVALKMVAAEAVAGVGASELLQEIALVSRLQHPNILPLFDAGERGGSPFYVMPWIRGGSLAALLQSRARLPLTEAISLLDGVAAGLAHAHENQILHCDIKPQNILVQDGHPWVMDFGIARKLHSEAFEWMSLRKELDFSAGTPAYVSPEQASGDPNLDQRSDVYSLACVAWEMIAGRQPFRGETTEQIVSRRFHESPPALREYAPDVPGEVASVIERAMSLDPAERPPTARAFAEELRIASRSASPWRTAIAVRRSRAVQRVRQVVSGPPPAREKPMPFREWLFTVRQDVAFAFRQRRRSPGLTLMAILTLGLGIGLTTAVFAVINGVLLQPLPFDEPHRLVSLRSVDSVGRAFPQVSSANWNDWNTSSTTLESSAIHQAGRVSVVTGAEALRANAQDVSVDFFRVLRSRFVTGRGFSSSDLAAGQRAAVVSEGFWRSTLGGAPIENQPLQVNGFSYPVVGVVASRHVYPEETQLFLLIRPRTFGGRERNNINYEAIGRLTPAVSVEQAGSDLSAVARRIRESEPVALYSYGVAVMPLAEHLVGNTTDLLALLMGSVGLVLLITCANLTSANLAQATVRRREMAVRTALGAGTSRLVRQVLVDHVAVALAGGLAGVGLAWLLANSAALIGAAELPRTGSIAIDGRVLLFALAISTLTGITTGLLPALRATRVDPGAALAGGSRTHTGRRGLPGRILVASEVAMALMLVTGAGLLVQSMRTVLARPLGFATEDVVAAEVTLSGSRYFDESAVLDYWSRLRRSLAEMPGSQGAGLVNWLPLARGGTGFIEVAGKDFPGAGAGYRMVSEGYFEALGMRVLQGRSFTEADAANGPRVAVISNRMAERYWPGESPLGRQVRASSMEPGPGGQPAPWVTVVGVVNNARPGGFESDETVEMYVLYRQLPAWRIATMNAVVRGTGSRSAFMRAVRERVNSVDPSIPADFVFLTTHVDRITAARRFTMATMTAFGALSLVLAAIGVYGVLSFAAAQQTREMAVRAALGADRQRLVRLFLGSGVRVVGAGVIAGIVGAWFVARLGQSLLFQVDARDPAIFAGAALTIALVGLLAAVVPARRASRVEPMEVLRQD